MKRVTFLLLCCFFITITYSQCLSYKIPLQQKVQSSTWIIIGKVTGKHTYTDGKNIYTLNKIDVAAWLKNLTSQSNVSIITIGGVLKDKAQTTYPAVQLTIGHEYVFFLDNNNTVIDDKNYRSVNPGIIQALMYADVQGALLYQNGKYINYFNEPSLTETELLQQLAALTGQQPKSPNGNLYTPRSFSGSSSPMAITGFSPSTVNAGTIVPGDFLTITGSGFGTSPGVVGFRNADDGGATFAVPPNTSDYVSWSDNSITVKVPAEAGTGTFVVNGINSPSPLTVNYAHTSIDAEFLNFTTSTRQRFYLRDKNSLGGYSFLYNNAGFSSNIGAVDAFERALITWRCPNKINFRSGGTTSSLFALDGENVVLTDNLPAGVLGRATSRYSGAGTASCDQANTVWWLDEIDIQFAPAPPGGFAWQFGPATASSSEYDFETVALHELGHAAGLGHVIAPEKLMHFALQPGENIRIPSTSDMAGLNAKLAYSIQPTCYNPAGSGVPMRIWNGSGCVLPGSIYSFKGSCKNAAIDLQWSTSFENNVDRFEVEKTIDEQNFQVIAKIKASNETQATYQFIDNTTANNKSLYRIKMIDKDGQFKYSSIIKASCSSIDKTFAAYPNPVKNKVIIETSTSGEFKLMDARGQMLKRFTLQAGRNPIDLTTFSNGVYILCDAETNAHIKIILSR